LRHLIGLNPIPDASAFARRIYQSGMFQFFHMKADLRGRNLDRFSQLAGELACFTGTR
jgi:hypothetical protein